MEQILKFYTKKLLKLEKDRLKNFDWKESTEIATNKKDYPLILNNK